MAGRRVKKAPYFRMFHAWWLDANVLALSLDAETVYGRSIGFSKGERLNGFLPEHALLVLFSKIATPPSAVVDEIVDQKLWLPTPDGWWIKNWTEYQTTAQEDDANRESTRTRKRNQRDRERAAATNGEEPDEPSRHDDAAPPPPQPLRLPTSG